MNPENIVSLSEVRKKRIQERRKNTKRTVLQAALSAYVQLSANKMIPVTLLDLSNDGLSFLVAKTSNGGQAIADVQVFLRIYLTQNTYFEVFAAVKNARDAVINGLSGVRYGCLVNEQQETHETFLAFVDFIRSYSLHAKQDQKARVL
jgi:hypothetical protein